jgi:hypothetical protein
MKFSFAHEFDIDVKGYWEMFLSPEFTETLMTGLKMKNFKIVSKTDDGKTMRRALFAEPQVAIPGMFTKFIPSVAYTEHDTLDYATNVMKVVVEPETMKDKFDTKGDYIVTPLGEGRCKREFRGECKVSIMMIGGKMEQFTVDQMKTSYDEATRITREWIATHKKA